MSLHPRTSNKPPYYLLTGFLVGLLVGLAVSLFFLPTYVDVTPQALSEDDRNSYRTWIGMAYAVDQDLGRAQARLALLKDKNPSLSLFSQSQQLLNQGGVDKAAQSKVLMQMATLLASPQTPLAPIEATPSLEPQPQATNTIVPDFLLTPSPTLDPNGAVMTATLTATATPTEKPETPRASFTPRATATLLPALGFPFELADQTEVCDPQLSGQLQLDVMDRAKNPVPGARITVTWQGGEDFFYTGLHPNINLGYADFTMQPDVTYSLKVGDLSKAVENLSAPKCKEKNGTAYTGGLMLHFNQP